MSRLTSLSYQQRADLCQAIIDAVVPVLDRHGISGSVAGQYNLYDAIEDVVVGDEEWTPGHGQQFRYADQD